MVWEILGRISHLLADMSVPAHVKNDDHSCQLNDPDGYELYMGGNSWNVLYCNDPQTSFPAQNWTALTAQTQGGLIDISGMNTNEVIRNLFYTQNQLADHFPSTDEVGDNNLPNGTNSYIQSRYQMLGPPPTNVNNQAIADETFNFCIRATATLFYWFSIETDLIPNTLVTNSFGGGKVKVNSTEYPSGYRIPAWNPQTTTLTAIDQAFDGCNWQFQNWQKIVNSAVVQTFSTRSINITPEANTTYKAVFIQPLSVTILGVTSHLPNAPQTFEASVSGTNSSVSYKWDVMNPCCLTKRNSIEKLPVCDIWNGLGTIGTNQQIEYTDGYNYILKIVVSDGFQIAEDYHDVTVGQCITGGGSSGCPFVYTWDGTAWVKDNNVLPTSEFPQNVGRDVTDYYKLHQPLAPRDGNYVLQLRELDDEHSFLDQVKLLVIDHPRPAEIAVTIDGEIVTFTTPMPPRTARHGNRDVSQKLSARDGDFIRGKSGETVELQFERPSLTEGETTSILLMEVSGDFSPKKIAGSIHSPKGEASTVSNFVLRERMSLIAVRLNSDGVGVNETVPESLDIAWHRDFLLDYVALAREPQIPVNIQELTLQRAVHSDGRDLSALLRSSDQRYAELLPGEHIELVFPAPAVRPGKRRSFLLVTQGRYIKADQDGKRVVESGGGPLPILLRNYPNPFNPSTLISYSLPADGFVTLRVYNLLGQEVAQLVNEQQRAGKHQIQFDVSSMASGVYVAKIAYTPVQAPVVSGEAGTPLKPEGTVIVTQRMMLVK